MNQPNESGPEPVHVTVHLTNPQAADAGPWWRPRGITRTALVTGAVLLPWPGAGAPAAWWAHLLNQAATEQSPAAAWTIGAAGIGAAWAFDRRRCAFDPERGVWRPFLLARALLVTTLIGAVLALPVFTTLVTVMTGVRP